MLLIDLPDEILNYIVKITSYQNDVSLCFFKYKKTGLQLNLYKYNGQLYNFEPHGKGYMKYFTIFANNNNNNDEILYNNINENFETIWIYSPLYLIFAKDKQKYFIK